MRRRDYVRAVRQIEDVHGQWLYRQVRRAYGTFRHDIHRDPTLSSSIKAVNRLTDSLTRIFTRYYTNVFRAVLPLLVMSNPQKSFPVETKEVQQADNVWVREKVGHRITRISESMLTKVQALFEQSNGEVDTFEQTITTMFSDVRARRIAVTETTSAMNASLEEQSRRYAFGAERVKTWCASQMTNMRPQHEKMDGVTIPADDYFEVENNAGIIEYLRYPADMSAGVSASTVVNCRCCVVYKFKDL